MHAVGQRVASSRPTDRSHRRYGPRRRLDLVFPVGGGRASAFRRATPRELAAPGALNPACTRMRPALPSWPAASVPAPGYNRAMAHRVTLIPGDGIGPELAEATCRVLDATGIGFEWEPVEAGELADREVRHAAPGARPRVGPAQQGRAQGPDHHPGRGRLPERQRLAPPGPRPVRQPAPGALDEGPRHPLRGRRPRHRPREHRGPLRRDRAHGRPRCRREHQDHHPGGLGADRPLRLRVRGRQRPAQGHGRPQGEHHEAVGRPLPRELSDGRRGL